MSAFVDRKRNSIATLKSLGSPGSQVVAIYLTQVMIIALIGVFLGLVVGGALPFIVDAAFGAALPIPLSPTLAVSELGLALLYGGVLLGAAIRVQVYGVSLEEGMRQVTSEPFGLPVVPEV